MYDENPGAVDFDHDLNAREKARLEAITNKVTADLAVRGITIDDARALHHLPAIRLAVLTDVGIDFAAVAEEVGRIPAVAEQARQKEIAAHLAAGTGEIHEELAKLNPTQRLTVAHQIEQARQAVAPAPGKQLSPADEASRIQLLLELPPSKRLAVARDWGLA